MTRSLLAILVYAAVGIGGLLLGGFIGIVIVPWAAQAAAGR